jgi:hypothetical protein
VQSALSNLLQASRRLDIPGKLAVTFPSYVEDWDDGSDDLPPPAALPNGTSITLTLFITQGGHPLSATASLALNGDGALSQQQVRTGATGRVGVTYIAPSSGEGVAYLSATALVGDQSESAMVPIQYG